MLVLSRREGEAITAGGVRFVVLSSKGGQVRIGIDAPPDVLILREELQEGPQSSHAGCSTHRFSRFQVCNA